MAELTAPDLARRYLSDIDDTMLGSFFEDSAGEWASIEWSAPGMDVGVTFHQDGSGWLFLNINGHYIEAKINRHGPLGEYRPVPTHKGVF